MTVLHVAATWKNALAKKKMLNQARSEVPILIAEIRSVAHFLLSHSFVAQTRVPTVAIWVACFKT